MSRHSLFGLKDCRILEFTNSEVATRKIRQFCEIRQFAITKIRKLRGLLRCQRGDCNALAVRRHDFHFFPVVGEFFAAIQADHVGPGDERGRGAPSLLHGDGKAIALVSTTEEGVQNPGKHASTSHREMWRSLGGWPASTYLDSAFLERVRLS